jgi:transcriptional regulator with XRE-family HTH domain
MEKKEMGQRLRSIRKEAGFSQWQLSVAANVPLGTLRNWEQGLRIPSLDKAARIAQALGVSLDHLAGLPPAQRRRGK